MWKYKVIDLGFKEDWEKELNKLGGDDWELVSTTSIIGKQGMSIGGAGSETKSFTLIFKKKG